MNSAATIVPRGEYDGRPLQSPPLLPRASAQAVRLARANTYDPITLRNMDALVLGGFVGLSIFGVLALAFIGNGEKVAAAVFAVMAAISGVGFLTSVPRRNRQEWLRDADEAAEAAVKEALAGPSSILDEQTQEAA